MPTRITTELNNTSSALWLAAEINGLTNPFQAVTFQPSFGQKFKFNGVIASIASGETSAPPAVYQFVGYGFDNLPVFPTDTLQGIFARVSQQGNDAFWGFSVNLDLGQHYYEVNHLFPFRHIRPNVSQFTFLIGVLATAPVNNFVPTLTVYGEMVNENDEDFPVRYR